MINIHIEQICTSLFVINQQPFTAYTSVCVCVVVRVYAHTLISNK